MQMHGMQICQVLLKECAEGCMGKWPQGGVCSAEGVRPKDASSHNQASGKSALEIPQVHI